MKQLLDQLAKELSRFNYIVQRNWENLPDSIVVNGHEDLDLFTTDQDKWDLQQVIKPFQEHIKIDVRSPEDDYYPEVLANSLLFKENQTEYGGFRVPVPLIAFLTLYYHSLVHKENNPYKAKLDAIFKGLYPPIKAKDDGVGFYGNN